MGLAARSAMLQLRSAARLQCRRSTWTFGSVEIGKDLFQNWPFNKRRRRP